MPEGTVVLITPLCVTPDGLTFFTVYSIYTTLLVVLLLLLIATVFASFNGLLPEFVINSLKDGIIEINKKLKGFLDDDAIITIVESRSSSPIRILREEYQSNISGVYPIGEGAGYAGGLTSAAADGLRVAEKLFALFGGANC